MRCSEVGLSLLALAVRKQVNCIMLQESQQLLLWSLCTRLIWSHACALDGGNICFTGPHYALAGVDWGAVEKYVSAKDCYEHYKDPTAAPKPERKWYKPWTLSRKKTK